MTRPVITTLNSLMNMRMMVILQMSMMTCIRPVRIWTTLKPESEIQSGRLPKLRSSCNVKNDLLDLLKLTKLRYKVDLHPDNPEREAVGMVITEMKSKCNLSLTEHLDRLMIPEEEVGQSRCPDLKLKLRDIDTLHLEYAT